MSKRQHKRGREKETAKRGFTLLIAALIASVVLALGTAIFQLAQKELTLSSLGRDSQFAFYAADTGSECALYWDVRHQRFPTTTPVAVEVTCGSQDQLTSASALGNTVTSSFQFEPNGYCVDVSVDKLFNAVTGETETTIRADGFSTTCEGVASSPRALQRSVKLVY